MDELDIFTYTDFRDYLRDWYRKRKERNPRFSHRMFARRLSSSDPSVLTNLISGRRRLTESRLGPFITALGLEGAPAEYFRLLVRLGQSEPGEDRERAWAALAQFRIHRDGPSVDRDQFCYLSSWHYAAVRTLAECEHFRPDPAWIAESLRPRIEVEQAAEALTLLERLGYLVWRGERLLPADPVLHSSEIVGRLGSYGYHRDSHRIAGDVMHRLLQRQVADETAFIGFTLAIPEHRLAELRTLLWEAQLQVLHRCEAWEGPRDRIAQVCIQMFPLSTSIHADEE